MADKLTRTFAGKQQSEIFEALVQRVEDIAHKYSLKVDKDPRSCTGRVHRPGADVKFDVKGDTLNVLFDFAFIVPKAIRERVKDELSARLDTLFK